MSEEIASYSAVFTTKTQYSLPRTKYMIPRSWARFHLSQLINKVLALAKPVPFEFLIRGEVLRSSLAEWCAERGVGEEETLEIEYLESIMPPEQMASFEEDDWVSCVSCRIPGRFLSGSYDGQFRIYDASQKLIRAVPVHNAPITSTCWLPSGSGVDNERVVATASQDATVKLTAVSLDAEGSEPRPLASLHLHTAPISSVSSNPDEDMLITASWDTTIGIWTTMIPDADETLPNEDAEPRTKKRRKVSAEGKRKLPSVVLKSHTKKVSGAAFTSNSNAVSCGLDSTVRTWDVEAGVCTNTITAAEKPFIHLGLSRVSTLSRVFVASTDRTLSLYDLSSGRSASAAPTLSFLHPSLPSCIATSTTDEWRCLTGSYDGIARIWDIRSAKAAVSSFHVFENEPLKSKGDRKILSLDWANGVVCAGGENGMEVWRVGESGTVLS
ncbi:WD40 repeat-like protein [Sistotremastrum niveocremeum HHB9708]|uniref:Ribosome biogenesis protein YTM1 n=1 Tax=Sistotremastrum niveocremeum HHB9708 TaxID=1314777 RepID=A0A164ZU37_9AGAM|nr:WD40 repeat-like protein [Sistotremastrum niveocremeum HHB9708]